MNTDLTTDTLHGVQPTLIGRYMVDTAQAPSRENCSSEGFYLNQPGFHCDVRYEKETVIDTESNLFGLDRRITKQEPPRDVTVEEPMQLKNKPMRTNILQSFEPQGTKQKRSCNVLSGIYIDRFENPKHRPQNLNNIVINEPFRGGFQSRLAAKDCEVNECGQTYKLQPTYGMRCYKNVGN